MFSEVPTKHAGNSPVTFFTVKSFAVLLRKLPIEEIPDSFNVHCLGVVGAAF